MSSAVFASIGKPVPSQEGSYADMVDGMAVDAATSALAAISLGRRRVVIVCEESIEAIFRAAASRAGVDFESWVTVIPPGDASKVWSALESGVFLAGIFIGGGAEALAGFDLFRGLYPGAVLAPVASTGGAAMEAARKAPQVDGRLAASLDYESVFCDVLRVAGNDPRWRVPDNTPEFERESMAASFMC